MSIILDRDIIKKIGFASHQNAVPILRELSLRNLGEEEHKNLIITLTSSPGFLEDKKWVIDSLKAEDILFIPNKNIKLDPTYLSSLSESLQGEIILTVSTNDKILTTITHPIEILSKNEWGGETMAQLLPAFSMPNDPVIDKILKMTSDILRRKGKVDALDGYKSQSRTRSWELVSALWSAVRSLNLSYAVPPASFETEGQKIRTPSLIFENKLATCLDSALLFSAAIEQMGLNPLIIFTKGHAFTGFWLQPQEFSSLITEEVSSVRKRLDLQEMVVFETTLITQSTVVFSQAIESAQHQLTEEDFIMAIDIRRARMQKIRPLALPTQASTSTLSQTNKITTESLEEAPKLPNFDIEISSKEPKNSADRLVKWQRNLLDLTNRNRLLNFSPKAKGIRLISPNPADLEDALSEGKNISIIPIPDLTMGGRDPNLYKEQNNQNLYDEFAREILKKREVIANLEKDKLDASLIDLYRKSRSDLDEGGANTLFLVIGFLKWKRNKEETKSYSAPLILYPVQLDRKSAISKITMRMLEEEPRFNLTLLELLRTDFALEINELESELPTDENGIDVNKIWNIVRRAVRDIEGFEVTTELVIGNFSFAKYLMWKDLKDRSEKLKRNDLVKYLMERGVGERNPNAQGEFPLINKLDNTIKAEDLFLPLPVDSSQLSAIVASAKNKSFVLDGPPGTGKSQTIANMIAHNLAIGRRVLFVAEKRAALDVVYRRLEEKGLGEFCLELHSNKTSKVEFLKQLDRAWDVRERLSEREWAKEANQVQILRNKLNNMVKLLHKEWPNGLTIYQAMGHVIKDASACTPKLMWPPYTYHDLDTMTHLREIVKRLELNRHAAIQYSKKFYAISKTEWTNGWQESIVAIASKMPNTIDDLQQAIKDLVNATGLKITNFDTKQLKNFIEFVTILLETYSLNFQFMFSPNFKDKEKAALEAIELINASRTLENALSVTYKPELYNQININQFQQDWQKAESKFWFLKTLRKKKIAKQLALVGNTSTLPNVENDLIKIQKIQENLNAIEKISLLLSDISEWNKEKTDLDKLNHIISLAHRINSMIGILSHSVEQTVTLRNSVSILIVKSNDLLSKEGPINNNLEKLKKTIEDYESLAERFKTLLSLSLENTYDFSKLKDIACYIDQNRTSLKSWCDWQRVKQEADNVGLQPLTELIVNNESPENEIATIFETAYARWFATWLIDSEPMLHNFVPVEHMSDIDTYRVQVDNLSELAVRYIRAKLCGVIPGKNDVTRQSGFGILKHELQKSRRHKAVRQLTLEMGNDLSRLAPCMLMSPLSIAQFLPPHQELFDLVIFDEASQITPWDAIGAIGKGKQVVVAGDPRQMPPTNFFNRTSSNNDDDIHQEDMESILDECRAAGIHTHSLNWHYRSRHESLITFSNHYYYNNDLITFPSAETTPSTVKWKKVDGVYSKGNVNGKGRHNQIEARAIVDETVKRLLDPHFIKEKNSIGIITLNTEQQQKISDLLDLARKENPCLERYFQNELTEPVFVKNLETVQGDERDIIMLSIAYGPTEKHSNTMSMTFGPLNREGGWRRLNVALTRARKEMLIFTSFDPSMIDLNRTNARAVRELKHFIEFAQQGPIALARAIRGSEGVYESPFEEAVAEGLRKKGWKVVPQVGVSRFRIDLGIVHPDREGDYLVGVECDGATYHSAPTARDRDKVRSAILEGLGWKLLRVWSTDWWVDKEGALKKLHEQIKTILAESKKAS